MTEKPSIFISYGRGDDHADFNDPDKSFLRKLYTDLKSAGYNVWWDRESMPARGLTFIDEIKSAITEHDRLILIVGPHAIGSAYVRYEWQHALSLCKPIIPILLKRDPDIADDKDQYDQIPAELKNYHTLNALEWSTDGDAYDRMLAELDRVLGDESTLGAVHNIPSYPPGYVQRDGFNAIQEQLLMKTDADNAPIVIAPHEQITTVQGAGGIGKTVLASAIGQSCLIRRHFKDGVYWVRLGKWEDVDVVSRQSALGLALGDKDTAAYMDAEGGKMRLSGLLHDKQVLIILDDVWDSRQIKAFDILGRNCRMLITSRQRNLVRGVTAHQLNKLSATEGIALIGGWLKRDPDADNPNQAEERRILELVDGYTLAVAIAGAKLADNKAGYSHSSLIERLEAGRLFQDLTLGRGELRNESLEVAIKLSYDDLTESDQRRFRQLGVLAPSINFDLPLIQAIWDDSKFDAEDALNRLVNSALLDRDKDNERWEQHSILRAYAEALLSDDEEHAAFERYVRHITSIAQFDDLPMEDWDTTIGPDYPHIDYLGDTLTEHCKQDRSKYQDITADFIWAVGDYVGGRPVLKDRELHGLTWLELVYQLYLKTDQQDRQATTLNYIGRAYKELGELNKALDYFQQALGIYREVVDKLGEADTLHDIGSIWKTRGELDTALDYYQKALPMQRIVGDKSGEATTLNDIGSIWSQRGESNKSLDYFQQASLIYLEIGNKLGEATTLNNIGGIWDTRGDLGQALDYYEQALSIHREVGAKSGEATTLNNIGGIWYIRGELDKALDYYQQSLKISHEIGAVATEAGGHDNLSTTYKKMGLIDEAIQNVKQAIILLESKNLSQTYGGTKIEELHARLKRWEREKLAQFKAPTSLQPQSKASNDMTQQFIDEMVKALESLYKRRGEKGVRRQLTKDKVADAMIEVILQRLRG